MKEPSAIKNDLFAPHQRAEQIDHLGDHLAQIEASPDFGFLAAEVDRAPNHWITKFRARVEHFSAGIEQMDSKFLRSIGQARANFVMTMMATCYNMKRLAYCDRVGITAF